MATGLHIPWSPHPAVKSSLFAAFPATCPQQTVLGSWQGKSQVAPMTCSSYFFSQRALLQNIRSPGSSSTAPASALSPTTSLLASPCCWPALCRAPGSGISLHSIAPAHGNTHNPTAPTFFVWDSCLFPLNNSYSPGIMITNWRAITK